MNGDGTGFDQDQYAMASQATIFTYALSGNCLLNLRKAVEGKWISYSDQDIPLIVATCSNFNELLASNACIAMVDLRNLSDQDWISYAENIGPLTAMEKNLFTENLAFISTDASIPDLKLHNIRLIEPEEVEDIESLQRQLGYELETQGLVTNLV